jgi:hypothetical protein
MEYIRVPVDFFAELKYTPAIKSKTSGVIKEVRFRRYAVDAVSAEEFFMVDEVDSDGFCLGRVFLITSGEKGGEDLAPFFSASHGNPHGPFQGFQFVLVDPVIPG